MIPLKWCVQSTTSLLEILDDSRVLEPASKSYISIKRQPSAPGLFNERLYLEVLHSEKYP